MNRQEFFNAKVLLFGEYSILLGSSAMSVPYGHFQAGLSFIHEDKYTDLDLARESNQLLKELSGYYLEKMPALGKVINLQAFRHQALDGLYLESTIPQGYGIGSSGALCAALYARFAINRIHASGRISKHEILVLRDIFAIMETWFHGKSSGIDPLVIYLRHPLYIAPGGKPAMVGIPRNRKNVTGSIFLINSGKPGKTSPLVQWFLETFTPGGKPGAKAIALCSATDDCISKLLEGKLDLFRHALKNLSRIQLKELSPMIPDHLRPLWAEGLDKDLFYLKLCGSGGGGFLIGFTPFYTLAQAYFEGLKIQLIPLYHAG